MIRANLEVLEKIKTGLYQSKREIRGLKLPSKINFSDNDNTVNMKLSATAVMSNMQGDNSAFEGWALILKRWGNYKNVTISWDKPGSIDNGHYQRFLFRVKHFRQDFGVWFFVDNDCQSLINDLKLNETSKYLLSFPKKRGNKVSPNPEAVLEDRFINDIKLNIPLMKISNANKIYRQLPIGVFENTVSKKTSIFTHGKSAVDIWGLSNANELLIFELKANDNKKVGIISELYFYVNVLQMVRRNIIKYEDCPDDYSQHLRISTTNRIKAYFLCPTLHPLIDKTILELLNAVNPKEISYNYIKFNDKYELTLDNV